MAARPVLAAVDGDGAPAPVTRLQPFRMLIAVPEALLAQGLRALVEREAGVAVSEASGVEELGAALGEGAVDVCLLDPALAGGPGREGLAELLERIRDWSPGTQVVVVGASLDLDDVCGALAAGATGVVDRTDEVDLLAATRAAAGGSVVLSPSVGTILTGGCGPRPGEAVGDAATRIEELTPRELEVLRCLAAGQRNTAIAESLVISERTVKTHVGRILQKLEVEDRTQAAVAALSAGVGGHDGADDARA